MVDSFKPYTLTIHNGSTVQTIEDVTFVMDAAEGLIVFRKGKPPVTIHLPERIEVHELADVQRASA